MNISYLYERYSTAVDFTIYCLVLVYACRIALARTFGETHGRSLGTVIGIMLAVSLSIAGKTLGFNLRSFGPMAAMVVLLILGLVVYNTLRHVGADHAACGSAAFIVTYFTTRSIAPGVFAYAQQNEWSGYLDAFLLLTVLVSVIRVIRTAFSSDTIPSVRSAIDRVSGATRQFIDSSRKQTSLEVSMVRKDLKGLTRHGRRDCRQVMNALREIIRLLRQNNANNDVASKAYQALQNLRRGESQLSSELARIQAIDEKLLKFDLAQYRELEQAYRQLTDQQKTQCKQLFARQRDKIGSEKAIRELTVRAETYAQQFDRCIETACQCLKLGTIAAAIQWMEKALAEEQVAERVIGEIRRQEKMLVHALRQQLGALASVGQ